jgi:hypothetical protein
MIIFSYIYNNFFEYDEWLMVQEKVNINRYFDFLFGIYFDKMAK